MNNENLKEKTEKEGISPEELEMFFKEKNCDFEPGGFEVVCDHHGIAVAEVTFDDIICEMEFIRHPSIKTKILITSRWPDSTEELKKVYDRDIKAFKAFLMLERNPKFRLKLPLDKYDLKVFLKDFNEYKNEINDFLDNFSYEINKTINAFSILEGNPELRLKLLEKNDLKVFLKDFNECKNEINDFLDNFSCEINKTIEKIIEENEDEQ
ncbi:MAG: hypothetical protein LBJ96_00380 [Holosporaceae bacterium]|nr:hypothetical protein [Holosporaceae bacterium]